MAISEGWTDAHRVQVGIRRLLKTALLWHVQTGHMHGELAIGRRGRRHWLLIFLDDCLLQIGID